ncbi:hypothetical protein GGE65_008173 [Skermanella aerolata]|uniref:hypothetical protein n=1 Tax=Skermanella aerolata TaxID=393310 RepID=UPI003D216498
MADTSKLKGRSSRMPEPPSPEQAGENLRAPEVAPAEPVRQRRDGRSLRATGRTHPFATRIKPETHEKMLDIAERDGITLGELIEKALEAYER